MQRPASGQGRSRLAATRLRKAKPWSAGGKVNLGYSLKNLSGLCVPQKEVQLVKIYADLFGKDSHLLLQLDISFFSRGRPAAFSNAQIGQPCHHVLVKDRIAAEADVPQEVAGFLITKPSNARVRREEIPPAIPVFQPYQQAAHAQSAMPAKILARLVDISAAGPGPAVGMAQDSLNVPARTAHQHRTQPLY